MERERAVELEVRKECAEFVDRVVEIRSHALQDAVDLLRVLRA